MSRINNLNITLNLALINNKYDFYELKTCDKYIKNGSYTIDKPISELKAESIVFEGGRKLYVMFLKNAVDKYSIIKSINDDSISINKIKAEELEEYLLIKLLLFSLNNYEYDNNKFNNIAGKLFITNRNWISKNKKTIKALNVIFDKNYNYYMEATTFSNIKLFNSEKIKALPKYSLSNKNYSLKRVFNETNEEVYIRKTLYGQKANVCYLDLDEKNIKLNKVYYMYNTLCLLKNKYESMFDYSFKEVDVKTTIPKYTDKEYLNTVKNICSINSLNLINMSKSAEYDLDFERIVDNFKNKKDFKKIIVSDHIEKDMYNIIYLHNKEFYIENELEDPYKNIPSNVVVQHITIEECSDKINDDVNAIYLTILKEMVIKNDILVNHKIMIDDWNKYGFENKIYFGIKKNHNYYFLEINKNGIISFQKRTSWGMNKDLYSDACYYLEESSKNKKDTDDSSDMIVFDSCSNYHLISRTNYFVIPSDEIFNLAEIKRNKETREKYFSGVLDINSFELQGVNYFNVGVKGSGMRKKIINSPIMYSNRFVGKTPFFDRVLILMSVPFVKYNSFTVIPYPFKYLREYMEMNK